MVLYFSSKTRRWEAKVLNTDTKFSTPLVSRILRWMNESTLYHHLHVWNWMNFSTIPQNSSFVLYFWFLFIWYLVTVTYHSFLNQVFSREMRYKKVILIIVSVLFVLLLVFFISKFSFTILIFENFFLDFYDPLIMSLLHFSEFITRIHNFFCCI